jgi:hypothetical protein
LKDGEAEVQKIEKRFSSVLKTCGVMVHKGESFGTAVKDFLGSIEELGQEPIYADAPLLLSTIAQCVVMTKELDRHRALLVATVEGT